MEVKRWVSTKEYKRFADPSDIDYDLIQDLFTRSVIVVNVSADLMQNMQQISRTSVGYMMSVI